MTDPTLAGAAAVLSKRTRAVQGVHSPLGFFVLALLIVEVFLLGAGIWFGLTEAWKLVALGVGVLLFFVVFITVVWLVVTRPQNLVFSEESHVQFAAMKMFGTESKLITGRDLDALDANTATIPTAGQITSGNLRP